MQPILEVAHRAHGEDDPQLWVNLEGSAENSRELCNNILSRQALALELSFCYLVTVTHHLARLC